MDLTYATIIVFGGEERRLYRESIFVNMVTKENGSTSSLVYGKEGELSCHMVEEDKDFLQETKICPITQKNPMSREESKIWTLQFDGANSREGSGARVLLISPEGCLVPLSFKMEFEATNNVAEYEALLLGLQTAQNMNI